MKTLLSTRELARAIGASESSLKRWADEGLIRVARTAGGHRRIPIEEAVRFIREVRPPLVHPEVLGLHSLAGAQTQAAAGKDVTERLYLHLREGRGAEARDLLVSLYLAGQSIAAIADGPLQGALERLGELWRHDAAGIALEHRATQLALAAVQQLTTLIPPPESRLLAVGGAPADDPYILPTLLAGAVLTSEGLHAVNLGPDTPLATLHEAARRFGAQLIWISVSFVTEVKALEQELRALADELGAAGIRLALGGRALPRTRTAYGDHVLVGESLSELAAYARGLRAAPPPGVAA